MDNFETRESIQTWKIFAKKVRSKGCNLLSSLNQYSNPVFVAGCQRSGTTAVANIISASDGMIDYLTERDSELDAALLLSGNAAYSENGRFCFQTTYLNECVTEYFKYIGEYKIIWLVRNPHSVIYSMLNNWGSFAFKELFDKCGSSLLTSEEIRKYKKFGQFVIPKLKRGCLSYNVKTSQALMLKKKLPAKDLLVVDYDDLISNAETKLELIYNFIELPFNKRYLSGIKGASVNKFQKLSSKKIDYISDSCMSTYEQVKSLAI